MAIKMETDQVRQNQAALEAVELLKERGFLVHDFDITTEPEGAIFSLSADLMLDRYERPLQE